MTRKQMAYRAAMYALTMFVLSFVFDLSKMISEHFGSRAVFVTYHGLFFFLISLTVQIYRDWRSG